MSGETDWVVFARWSLGELTNEQYAEHLRASGVPEDDLIFTTLQTTTRGDEDGPDDRA